ncbi:MFS transporter [Caenimonas sedimenti]|uniref:MFS transporter n=1 Tax=Caenimonas sedimenti TaxID=2596921 RepID=A0A562ZDT8_9BURK|nr:MFS transporter [Caenimonas sedimenti]TWO63587.1 MFS transporter [Caenimonas sedimenti]
MTSLAASATASTLPDRLAGWMVGTCAVMVMLGFGAIVNMAVFLTPLAAEFGWSRGELSLAYSFATIGTGIGGIVMGHFADRLPVRRLALCGAIVPGVALLLLARMQTTFELYLLHAVMGLFGIGALMAPLNSAAALWLAKRPGLAIGLVNAGGALGQGVLPYLARNLVLIEGWRAAYATLGVIYLVCMVPLAFFLRDPPRAAAADLAAAAVAASPYRVSRNMMLAWLCVGVVFCCVCMATPIMHVATFGADRGLGPRESAGLLAVMMVCGMAGRIGFGKLADRFGNLQAYMVASAGQTFFTALFPLAQTSTELYLLSAAFGLMFSGSMTSLILCAREYAPLGRTGLFIGIAMFFGWLGMALGGWQGGLFYDLCGNYDTSFTNGGFSGVANLLVLGLLWTLSRPARTPPR